MRLSTLRAAVLLGGSLSLPLASVAHAGDPKERGACVEAAAKAQSLLDEHKLRAAREQLVICGRSVCPGPVLVDCVTWFNQTKENMPTLALSAKDSDGHELTNVTVTIDGILVTNHLDGLPVEVDPGAHRVSFESADGSRAEEEVLARLGEKGTHAFVQLRPKAAAVIVPAFEPASPSASGTAHKVATTVRERPASSAASTIRIAGWVGGAVGIIGLGIGTGFGLDASAKSKDAGCVDAVCGSLDAAHKAKAAATDADVGFIAGGLLAAGGLVAILAAPAANAPAAEVTLRPLVGPGVVGMQLHAAW